MNTIVPRYWAQAKKTWKTPAPGRTQTTLQRWGWSFVSQAEAEQHAQIRLEEAYRQYTAPERPKSFFRFEPKVPYNGAQGVPIREEILEEREVGVITRNSYGAECLNTEHVMILDFDEDHITWQNKNRLRVFQLFFVAIAPFVMMSTVSFSAWAGWAIGAWLVSGLIRTLMWKIYVASQGGTMQVVLRRLQQAYPSFRWRVYQTPNGWRAIETSTIHDPSSRLTQDLMSDMQVDPLYQRMCKHQRCFRARLTPKPWRMGMDRMKRMIWPVENAERFEERTAWVEAYNETRKTYAACAYLTGDLPQHEAILEVVAWHDEKALGDGQRLA